MQIVLTEMDNGMYNCIPGELPEKIVRASEDAHKDNLLVADSQRVNRSTAR